MPRKVGTDLVSARLRVNQRFAPYFDGHVWEVSRSKDFGWLTTDHRFRAALYGMARRLGLRMTVKRVEDDVYWIQAYQGNGERLLTVTTEGPPTLAIVAGKGGNPDDF